MRNFKVGDPVKIIRSKSKHFGVECKIIRCLTMTSLRKEDTPAEHVMAYRVNLRPDPPFQGTSFQPHDLVLIYDGHEKCSWENSAWVPSEPVLVEAV